MFAFVPRKVARPARPTAAAPPTQAPIRDEDEARTVTDETLPLNTRRKDKLTHNGLPEEDYAIHVILALSDHAIWVDADLRRTMASGDETFIPLSYLMHHSSILAILALPPSETVLAKSLRVHAKDILEVRMLVATSSHSGSAGGFEVRRCDWRTVLQRCRNYSRTAWEERTVYMENIPLQFRSVPGIYRFSQALVSRDIYASAQIIQAIHLPPHHQDRQGDIPKCKGFALVTLLEQGPRDDLLSTWPWAPRRTTLSAHSENNVANFDAVKFGFRVTSKAAWSRLNEEYLSYRQKLSDEIASADIPQRPAFSASSASKERRACLNELSSAELEVHIEETYTPNSSAGYPVGCLVFVRNIHSETNKTTLRALFSQPFAGTSPDAFEAINYVDFNKGMETCYLRLISPFHTEKLTHFYAENSIVQTQALDCQGGDAASHSKLRAISVEIVDGAREELYWMNVPVKVRRQAMDKAIAILASEDGFSEDKAQDASNESKRKRKRRRHG